MTSLGIPADPSEVVAHLSDTHPHRPAIAFALSGRSGTIGPVRRRAWHGVLFLVGHANNRWHSRRHLCGSVGENRAEHVVKLEAEAPGDGCSSE
ncbi:MAG: hypothetical protein ACQEWM_12160 [Actinomycetota bacterium]